MACWYLKEMSSHEESEYVIIYGFQRVVINYSIISVFGTGRVKANMGIIPETAISKCILYIYSLPYMYIQIGISDLYNNIRANSCCT